MDTSKQSNKPAKRPVIVNLLGYQIGWFVAILAAAKGVMWPGLVVILAFLAIHLFLAQNARAEFILICIAILFGIVGDSALILAGRLTFMAGTGIEWLSPLWMIGLWALFATTFNVSLRWLREKLLLSALLGALGGPLAYLAGGKLGAATIHEPLWLSLLLVGLVWMIATPLLIRIATRFDGFAEP